MRIADVLRRKGSTVSTVDAATSVTEVLKLLSDGNFGAMPVVDGNRLVGIVSERDIVRRLHQRGATLLNTSVSEVMTTDVVTCLPEDSAIDLAKIMTNRRIRHLPVVVEGKLCGIVSIGDLVKLRIDLLEEEREQLVSYIAQ